MKYEIKVFGADPFDIMCGDCPVHEIWWWESVTLEGLHDAHNEELSADASLPDRVVEEMQAQGEWHPAPHDFDEWLKERIEEGYIRAVV